MAGGVGQQYGERANTCVCVNEQFVAAELQALGDECGEALCLRRVDLREGRGSDTEAAIKHLLPVVGLSCGKRDVGIVHCGLDEPVAGVDAVANGKLGGLAGFALQFTESFVNPGVHEGAVFNLDEAAGEAVDESEHPGITDGEARVVAVAEHLGTWQSRGDGNAAQFRVFGERQSDAVLLELELVVVSDVLPLAACACGEVWTGRCDTVRRRFEDFSHDGGYVLAASAAVADDAGLHPLAGYAAKYVDYAFLEVRQGIAEIAPSMEE